MPTRKSYIRSAFDISRETIEHGWTMPYTHYHPDYEIYILESGQRIVTIDGQEYETLAGDAALFAPMLPHTSRGTTPFSGICIHFSEEFIKNSFSDSARKALLKCFSRKIIHLSQEQMHLLSSLLDWNTTRSPYRFMQLGLLLELLSTAIDTTEPEQKEASSSQQPHQENKASQLLRYVEENYVSIQNIEELTQLFNVSESYIFRIFKEKLSVTPKQYINQLRIDTITHRLRYSNKSIKALAADCGFDCYEYFVRVFKAQIGCTPSEYRKRITLLKNQPDRTLPDHHES